MGIVFLIVFVLAIFVVVTIHSKIQLNKRMIANLISI